jgi:hypothetical protein
MEELFEWLDKNPISSNEEVLFLKSQVETSEQVAKDSMEAAKAEAEMLESKRWQGESPYLRLIHCIIDHDEIKMAFLRRHDLSSSRMEVENRNSVSKKNCVGTCVGEMERHRLLLPDCMHWALTFGFH